MTAAGGDVPDGTKVVSARGGPPPRRRGYLLMAGLAAAAVVAVAAGVGRGPGDLPADTATAPDRPTAGDAVTARVDAEQACVLAGRFLDQVRSDAPADEALRTLDQARTAARRAAAGDPTHQALAGGLGAMREALESDDPGAADVALRVIQTECGAR